MRTIVIIAALLASVSASAQSTVNQGQGQSSGSKPWVVQGSTATTSVPLPVSTTLNTGAKNSEVCVTNAAGGTSIVSFAARRSVLLQNVGPNPIFCTFDGQNPTTALGARLLSGETLAADVGPALTIKCIAATAAQVTPACTQVTELK